MNLTEKIRQFNRFYLPYMHLLGEHYLGSEYSVPEARIFFEIYANEGCNAAHIAQIMDIDKSYLSRIIRRHGFTEIPVDRKKFPFERADIAFEMKLQEIKNAGNRT